MDKLSAEQRHKNMAAIHSKDTKPEMIVRKGLWSRGFRYRLNSPKLPGHPDLVLRKYRTCIFVNGCFWHGHGVELKIDNSCVSLVASGKAERKIENSECCKIPNTNREFWVAKIREETLKALAYTLNKIWLDDHQAVVTSYPKLEEESEGYLKAAEERE